MGRLGLAASLTEESVTLSGALIDKVNCISRINKNYDIFNQYQELKSKGKNNAKRHTNDIQGWWILLKPSLMHLTSYRSSDSIPEGQATKLSFVTNLAQFFLDFSTFLLKLPDKSTGGSSWHKNGYRGDFAKVFFQGIKWLLAKFFSFFQ